MTAFRTKKKKVSKKKKQAWRKYADIKDVEKFLDSQRLEERLGSFANKDDSELFVISKGAESLSKKCRRELLRSKEPRCFSILKPHTAVPDPIVKRNRVRTKEERTNKLVLRKEAIRKSLGILKLKEKVRLKNRILAAKKRLIKPKRGEFKTDTWEETDAKDINCEWMSPNTLKHTLTHFGVKKKKLPAALHKKPSGIPSVEPPHPGMSYNPSFEDHQKLLHEIAEKELQLIKEEKHLERVTTKMFKKVTHEEKENNTMKEMLEGLPINNSGKVDQDEDDLDPTVKSVNPPVQNRKKTRVQRRKQREQKALAFKQQHKKVEKKKIADIYKLKKFDKQLVVKQQKEKVSREKRMKKKADKALGTKTLSRVKFEPLEDDFKLAKELTGNLRNTEPSNNLLKDRFKSLQKRNIVAPSNIKLKRDKAKVKRFIKSDHKIDLPNVKLNKRT